MYSMIETHRLNGARRLKRQLISEAMVEGVPPEDCYKSDSYIDNLVVDVAVSFDGSWKDRGHSSHHGVVAAISQYNGEVLDVEYLNNYCRWGDYLFWNWLRGYQPNFYFKHIMCCNFQTINVHFWNGNES